MTSDYDYEDEFSHIDDLYLEAPVFVELVFERWSSDALNKTRKTTESDALAYLEAALDGDFGDFPHNGYEKEVREDFIRRVREFLANQPE